MSWTLVRGFQEFIFMSAVVIWCINEICQVASDREWLIIAQCHPGLAEILAPFMAQEVMDNASNYPLLIGHTSATPQ